MRNRNSLTNNDSAMLIYSFDYQKLINMRHRPISYSNRPRRISRGENMLFIRIILFILGLLLLNNILLAEGTAAIAPSPADGAGLFIGAGNTGSTGGDYGEFAWKGSNSKLFFNIQNTCEKAYFGFSIPKKDRSFRDLNTNGNPDFERNLIFRILDPHGNPINDLDCFGNMIIDGDVWQTLRQSDINLETRAQADIGPQQLAAGGYNAFELDLSACGLTLTGNYSIEFFHRNNSYNTNTRMAGFYIEYFDVTVANCANRAVTGRLWSNNWGLAIKKDGDGPFDRAFNGAFYICSKEGFITKIDFNTKTNNRTEVGKNNDQQSGFRAGAFNVSFNTFGPNKTGDIQFDRKSVYQANSPNPELPVFLNLPDPSFCPPQSVGDFKAKNKFISGCPGDYCVNVSFSKPGQIEVLFENGTGNRLFDHPSEVRLVAEVTEAHRVPNPEDPNFPYEVCLPWNGNNGYGNRINFSDIFVSGFYYQGIYHFPVYDAEFNDDGFIVETVRPALGIQKLFYDDQNIPSTNLSGENKDGSNGCLSPCHRWTGEYEDYEDRAQIFGNFNTINTWWFGNSSFKDFTLQASPKPSMTCPTDYVGCPGDDIGPNVIGSAQVTTANPVCTVIEYVDRVRSQNTLCTGTLNIERKWRVYLTGLEEEAIECIQRITLEDRTGPILSGVPENRTVSCDNIPPIQNTVSATDDCNLTSELVITVREETFAGSCAGNYQIRRIWTAIDQCGNRNSREQILTVEDNTAPTISGVPTSLTVRCTDIPSPATTVQAVDNCEAQEDIKIEFREEKIAGNCAGNYTIKRTWTATDRCGNASNAVQTITVVDYTAPSLTNIPENLTVLCTEVPNPPLNISAVDNCESLPNIEIGFVEEKIAGNCAGNYTLKRVWTATDACGNTSSGEQIITVIDNVSPTILGTPADETVLSTEIPSPPNNITALDNCEGQENVMITYNEERIDGNCAGNFTLKRTWTATDACGNSSSTNQTITVTDNFPPELNGVPNDTTVDCHTIPVVPTNITAVDNSEATQDITITFQEERIDGNCVGNYLLKRTWTATDVCGNASTYTQIIEIQDVESPILLGIPSDISVECDAVPTPAMVAAADNCTADEEIMIVYKELRLNGECQGNYQLKRAWTATDLCGNVSLAEQIITVTDNTAPQFLTCPNDINVGAIDDCQSDILDIRLPTVIDNCDEAVSLSVSTDLSQPFPIGTTVVIFTATDNCGNRTTCEFKVQVENTPQDYCPSDMEVFASCNEEPQAAVISWEPPNGNSCCSSCPSNTHIDGFIYLGERGGHRYYYSLDETDWREAHQISDDLEGYLVGIDDPAENNFITNFVVDGAIHLGLTDEGSLGEFYWQDDADTIFENWAEGVLENRQDTTQYGQLTPNGDWTLSNGEKPARFIVEIPCMDLTQLSGPMNGSKFPVGTTSISYLLDYDNCQNSDTCSFQVTVKPCEQLAIEEYCEPRVIDTTCFWIEDISIGGEKNKTGNNGGFAEFIEVPMNIFTEFEQSLTLTPGFAPGHTFYVYWRVWIDYNQNNIFEAEEMIFETKEYRPVKVKFIIPSTAKYGLTRLRIAMNFADDEDPCAVLAFGEVEDYLVNIEDNSDNLKSGSLSGARFSTAPRTSSQVISVANWPKPAKGFTPYDLVASRGVTMKLFPNPVKNLLTVSIANSVELEKIVQQIHLTIYNQMGQQIYQDHFLHSSTQTNKSLDLSYLPSGLYFLQLELGGIKTMKRKFVKLN